MRGSEARRRSTERIGEYGQAVGPWREDWRDSDSPYPPELIPLFVRQLRAGSRVIVRSRMRGMMQDGAMSHTSYVRNRLLSWFASVLFRVPV